MATPSSISAVRPAGTMGRMSLMTTSAESGRVHGPTKVKLCRRCKPLMAAKTCGVIVPMHSRCSSDRSRSCCRRDDRAAASCRSLASCCLDLDLTSAVEHSCRLVRPVARDSCWMVLCISVQLLSRSSCSRGSTAAVPDPPALLLLMPAAGAAAAAPESALLLLDMLRVLTLTGLGLIRSWMDFRLRLCSRVSWLHDSSNV